MWNLADNSLVLDTKSESIWLGSVQFSPDGTRYLTAGTDRVIRIWDSRSHVTARSCR